MEEKDDIYAQKVGKEFKERMNWFREVLKDDERKDELHGSLEGSQILIRLEVFLPSKDPDQFQDGLYLYIDNSGKIVDADYYYRDNFDGAVTRLYDDDLEVVRELFQDAFSLEIE